MAEAEGEGAVAGAADGVEGVDGGEVGAEDEHVPHSNISLQCILASLVDVTTHCKAHARHKNEYNTFGCSACRWKHISAAHIFK